MVPLFQPAVLFAGEHTHSNFYSTVHGAYLSGRTAAQLLLQADTPQEIIMESDSTDISSWIQGMAIDWDLKLGFILNYYCDIVLCEFMRVAID